MSDFYSSLLTARADFPRFRNFPGLEESHIPQRWKDDVIPLNSDGSLPTFKLRELRLPFKESVKSSVQMSQCLLHDICIDRLIPGTRLFQYLPRPHEVTLFWSGNEFKAVSGLHHLRNGKLLLIVQQFRSMKREKRVQLWMNDKEYGVLVRLAAKEQISISEYIRRLVDREPESKE